MCSDQNLGQESEEKSLMMGSWPGVRREKFNDGFWSELYLLDISGPNTSTNFIRFRNTVSGAGLAAYTTTDGISFIRYNSDNHIRMTTLTEGSNYIEFNSASTQDSLIYVRHSGTASSRYFAIYLNGNVERVRMDYLGNWGFGLTAPSEKLDVSGYINISSGSSYKINGTAVLSSTALTVPSIRCSGAISAGSIACTGNTTIGGNCIVTGTISGSVSGSQTVTSLICSGAISAASATITGAITKGGIVTTPNTKYTNPVSNCTQVGSQTGTSAQQVDYAFTNDTSQSGITLSASSNSSTAWRSFGTASSNWVSDSSAYNSSGVQSAGYTTNGYTGERVSAIFTSAFIATGMTFTNLVSGTGAYIKSYVVQGFDVTGSTGYLLASNTITSPTSGTVTVTFNTSGIPPIYQLYFTISSMTGTSYAVIDDVQIQGYTAAASSCTYFPNSVEIGPAYGTTYDSTTPLAVNGTCRVGNDQVASKYVTGGLFYYRQILQPCVWRGTTVITPQNSSGITVTVTITGPYVNMANSDLFVSCSNGDYGANNGFFPMSGTALNGSAGSPAIGDRIVSIIFWCRCNSTNNARLDYGIHFTPMY